MTSLLIFFHSSIVTSFTTLQKKALSIDYHIHDEQQPYDSKAYLLVFTPFLIPGTCKSLRTRVFRTDIRSPLEFLLVIRLKNSFLDAHLALEWYAKRLWLWRLKFIKYAVYVYQQANNLIAGRKSVMSKEIIDHSWTLKWSYKFLSLRHRKLVHSQAYLPVESDLNQKRLYFCSFFSNHYERRLRLWSFRLSVILFNARSASSLISAGLPRDWSPASDSPARECRWGWDAVVLEDKTLTSSQPPLKMVTFKVLGYCLLTEFLTQISNHYPQFVNHLVNSRTGKAVYWICLDNALPKK